jgi:hypothetical protein
VFEQGIVRKFGDLIAKAERRTIDEMKDGRIETEPSATDRFLARIVDVCQELDNNYRVAFKARTLGDRGKDAPESQFGADFCGVLDSQNRFFRQIKGFLTQAKIESKGIIVRSEPYASTTVKFTENSEFRRLIGQIDRMLSITPDSYVIIYSLEGFVVVPALSVRGLKAGGELYAKSVPRFFKEVFMCFIGDGRLQAYDDTSLRKLSSETGARNALLLEIREDSHNTNLKI